MLLLVLSVFSTGCAYECRWKKAGQTPTAGDSIDGRWSGTWQSDANGHSGGLRCIVTPAPDGHYQADFKASYACIFSFGYKMTMNVKAKDADTRPAVVYFTGEADLGWLAGGKYTYEGRATPTDFFCQYKSEGDHGAFRLVRPGGTPEQDQTPIARRDK